VRRGGLRPAHVVAKEAGALWTPTSLGAYFTEAEERRHHWAPTWPRGGGGLGHRVPAWARWRRNGIRAPAGKSAAGGRAIYGARVRVRVSGGAGPSAWLLAKSPYFHWPAPDDES
jgi:hypothetical protein